MTSLSPSGEEALLLALLLSRRGGLHLRGSVAGAGAGAGSGSGSGSGSAAGSGTAAVALPCPPQRVSQLPSSRPRPGRCPVATGSSSRARLCSLALAARAICAAVAPATGRTSASARQSESGPPWPRAPGGRAGAHPCGLSWPVAVHVASETSCSSSPPSHHDGSCAAASRGTGAARRNRAERDGTDRSLRLRCSRARVPKHSRSGRASARCRDACCPSSCVETRLMLCRYSPSRRPRRSASEPRWTSTSCGSTTRRASATGQANGRARVLAGAARQRFPPSRTPSRAGRPPRQTLPPPRRRGASWRY